MVNFATAYEALKGQASEKSKRFRASGPEAMVSATPEARFEKTQPLSISHQRGCVQGR